MVHQRQGHSLLQDYSLIMTCNFEGISQEILFLLVPASAYEYQASGKSCPFARISS
jgi:hypothetical protein